MYSSEYRSRIDPSPSVLSQLDARLSSSWTRSLLLIRESFGILWAHKRLLAFPIAASVLVLSVASGFLLRLLSSGAVEMYTETHRIQSSAVLMLFVWYYFHYFVILFFNSALMACADRSLSGREPSLWTGLKAATERWFQIAMWTLVAATLGVFMKFVEGRSRRMAAAVATLLGLTWTFATFFVVPVLMFDKDRSLSALRTSMTISRQTWGEQITNHVGFGVFTFLFAIPGLVLALLGTLVNPVLLLPAILYSLMLSVILSAARSVFTVALYRYATTGRATGGFSQAIIGPPGRPD